MPGLRPAQFQLTPVPWKGWPCLHEANNRVDKVVSARSLAAVRLHQATSLDRRCYLPSRRPGQNHHLAFEMRDRAGADFGRFPVRGAEEAVNGDQLPVISFGEEPAAGEGKRGKCSDFLAKPRFSGRLPDSDSTNPG